MSRFFIFYFLFFISSLWRGEDVKCQIIDSIQISLQQKPCLIGGFSTKSSFIDNFRSPIFSMHIGVDFDNRIRICGGISWLNRSPYSNTKNNAPFYFEKIIIDSLGNTHTLHSALRFVYFDSYIEYVFYRTTKWQFSIPLHFGIGDTRYEYIYKSEKKIESKKIVFLYQPTVSGHYKIFKWFGVGADVGYRMMIINNKLIGKKFNSPIYDIKAIIFWKELYYDLRKKLQ
ncbi:MAG: hypothetical protein V1781_06310 [Bacteroidota bacterium]